MKKNWDQLDRLAQAWLKRKVTGSQRAQIAIRASSLIPAGPFFIQTKGPAWRDLLKKYDLDNCFYLANCWKRCCGDGLAVTLHLFIRLGDRDLLG